MKRPCRKVKLKFYDRINSDRPATEGTAFTVSSTSRFVRLAQLIFYRHIGCKLSDSWAPCKLKTATVWKYFMTLKSTNSNCWTQLNSLILYARTELAQLSFIFLNDEPCWIRTLCCHNFSQRQQFFVFLLMTFIFRTLRNVRKDFLEKLTSELADPNLSTKNRSLEIFVNILQIFGLEIKRRRLRYFAGLKLWSLELSEIQVVCEALWLILVIEWQWFWHLDSSKAYSFSAQR